MKLSLEASYLNEQYNNMGFIDIIGFSGSSFCLCLLEIMNSRQFDYETRIMLNSMVICALEKDRLKTI